MKFSTKNWFPLIRYLIVMWTGLCIVGLLVIFFISPIDFINYTFKSAHEPDETKGAVNLFIVSIIIGLPISLIILKEIQDE